MERTDEPVTIDPLERNVGLIKTLGFVMDSQTSRCVKMHVDVGPQLFQPEGFVHGGVALALLETCASWASQIGIDNDRYLTFGSHIDIHHVNSIKEGTLHGRAVFAGADDLGPKGLREHWAVEATDEAGKIISKGEITMRVVSKDYFGNRARKQEGK